MNTKDLLEKKQKALQTYSDQNRKLGEDWNKANDNIKIWMNAQKQVEAQISTTNGRIQQTQEDIAELEEELNKDKSEENKKKK